VTGSASESDSESATSNGVDHGPFKLNGERLLLKGTCRHEDHAGLGAAMTEDLIRKEMLMIKDMGANFVRLGHYQQSRIVLDLCDEGPRRARPDAEGRFLRLPIVLGGKTDGAYLRALLAHALGQ
jgi:hypothetical protein